MRAMPTIQCHPPLLLGGLLLALTLALGAGPVHGSTPAPAPAPGRAMAQHSVQGQKPWTTVDHTKHPALQQDFTSGKQITDACVSCHSEAATQFQQTIHWTWQAAADGEAAKYGKASFSLNNFCLGTNRNVDTSCLSCHPGWNKSGNSVDGNINCLVCHGQKSINWDESLEDIKAFVEAGDEDSLELAREIQGELKEAVQAVGLPTRANCGGCHFTGGGGDGVKHGDLDTSLTKPAKTLDVHMGMDGQDFTCTRCHTTVAHRVAGRVYTAPAALDRKSLVEDDQVAKIACESCHTATPHQAGSKANDHTDKVACQSCHIPEMARVNPTKVSWDWSAAGRLQDGKPFKTQGEFGKEDYLSIKGQMQWAKNLQPEYFWYNGTIHSVTAQEVIDPAGTVAVSWPEGARADAQARIAPFKVHRGKQPYDKIHKTLLVPVLSSADGYWRHLDWPRALSKGQEALGLPFSGEFDFVSTTYVFPTTHMVAPKESAVACAECHVRDGGRLASLQGFYMPGRDRAGWLNTLGWLTVLGSMAGVGLHALGRFITRGRNGRKEGS